MDTTINSKLFNDIYKQAISKYHQIDDVEQPFANVYVDVNSLENLLYYKCWIDTVQWHLEDLIRDPEIIPQKAVDLKREIDASNQRRTDIVEQLDDYLFNLYNEIPLQADYRINTESIGWALDRLSILNLKVYHWQEETKRKDITAENLQKAEAKLTILDDQLDFLSKAIDFLLMDIFAGKATARPFKQMKMYNDPETNPILRKRVNTD